MLWKDSVELPAQAPDVFPDVGQNAARRAYVADHRRKDSLTYYEPVSPKETAASRGRESLQRRSLAVGDVLGVVVAYCVALSLSGAPIDRWILLTAIMVVPLNKMLGLYDRDAHLLNKTTVDELPRLFDSAVLLAFAAALTQDLVNPAAGSFGARFLIALVLTVVVALIAGRLVVRRLARNLVPGERCLAVGDDEATDHLRRKIAMSPTVRANVVGRIPLSDCTGSHRALREAVAMHSVDRIIVCPESHDPEEVADALRALRGLDIRTSVVPPIADIVISATERDEVSGLTIVGLKDCELSYSSRAVKRTLDIVAAGTLLMLLSPVFLLFAIAIRFDSAGPSFYRQRRIGRHGHGFEMLKFRTMVDGADRQQEALRQNNESDGLFKLTDDPRVTRVGGLLRRTSLDELPQLINVLRGDMSLVGPRPLVPEEDESIGGWYRRRSQITPGMTGVWQLHGPVRIPLPEMVKLDYMYVATWSIWGDIKILFQTVPHVLARRGL